MKLLKKLINLQSRKAILPELELILREARNTLWTISHEELEETYNKIKREHKTPNVFHGTLFGGYRPFWSSKSNDDYWHKVKEAMKKNVKPTIENSTKSLNLYEQIILKYGEDSLSKKDKRIYELLKKNKYQEALTFLNTEIGLDEKKLHYLIWRKFLKYRHALSTGRWEG